MLPSAKSVMVKETKITPVDIINHLKGVKPIQGNNSLVSYASKLVDKISNGKRSEIFSKYLQNNLLNSSKCVKKFIKEIKRSGSNEVQRYRKKEFTRSGK